MTNPSIRNSLNGNFSFVRQVLRGLGQIMLQENALTGLLFLLGIFYGSVFMGLGALVATACGTMTAYLFHFDKAETEKGLYGFSAALVGVALTLFLKSILFCWILRVCKINCVSFYYYNN
jgi:urea transporter